MPALTESLGVGPPPLSGPGAVQAPSWDGSDVLANGPLRLLVRPTWIDVRSRVSVRTAVHPPAPIQAAIRAAQELAALAPGWNSYRAEAISDRAIAAAIQFLLEVASDVPALASPSVVPTVRGGVQLEWHAGGVDVEVEFSPSQPATWYAEDRDSGDTDEAPVAGQFDRLSPWLLRASR